MILSARSAPARRFIRFALVLRRGGQEVEDGRGVEAQTAVVPYRIQRERRAVSPERAVRFDSNRYAAILSVRQNIARERGVLILPAAGGEAPVLARAHPFVNPALDGVVADSGTLGRCLHNHVRRLADFADDAASGFPDESAGFHAERDYAVRNREAAALARDQAQISLAADERRRVIPVVVFSG